MLAYSPWIHRCCQHNVSHGWPYYAEELWLATGDNGLCTSLYCASEVTAKVGEGTTVTIAETTNYPFGETIRLEISTPKQARFPLYLRIPRWCKETQIKVNGRKVVSRTAPLSYAVLEKPWSNGDIVEIEFPARITVDVWEKNRNSVSVNRGALTFSLKIGEKWVKYDGREWEAKRWVRSDDVDKWPAYEVYPTTAWNYGLVLDAANAAASFEVVKKSGVVAEQRFTPEAAPIELRAKARRIREWKIDEQGLVGVLPESPVTSNEPLETVSLIPMGCARLRVSAFPTVSIRTDATE